MFTLINAAKTLIFLMFSFTRGIYCTSVRPGRGIPHMWLSLRFLLSFYLLKGFFSSFSLLLLRVKGRGCHTLLKPYETNCDLWIWAIQIKFDWLIDMHVMSMCSTPSSSIVILSPVDWEGREQDQGFFQIRGHSLHRVANYMSIILAKFQIQWGAILRHSLFAVSSIALSKASHIMFWQWFFVQVNCVLQKMLRK